MIFCSSTKVIDALKQQLSLVTFSSYLKQSHSTGSCFADDATVAANLSPRTRIVRLFFDAFKLSVFVDECVDGFLNGQNPLALGMLVLCC